CRAIAVVQPDIPLVLQVLQKNAGRTIDLVSKPAVDQAVFVVNLDERHGWVFRIRQLRVGIAMRQKVARIIFLKPENRFMEKADDMTIFPVKPFISPRKPFTLSKRPGPS